MKFIRSVLCPLLALFSLVSAGSSLAQTISTNNLIFNFSDFGLNPNVVYAVTITPRQWLAVNNGFLLNYPKSISRAMQPGMTNGSVTFSNQICGVPYQVQFSGYSVLSTNFFVPANTNSNVVVNGQYTGQYGSPTVFFYANQTVIITNVYITISTNGGNTNALTAYQQATLDLSPTNLASGSANSLAGHTLTLNTNLEAAGAAQEQAIASTNFSMTVSNNVLVNATNSAAATAANLINGIGSPTNGATLTQVTNVANAAAQAATNGLPNGAFTVVGNAAVGNTNTMKFASATNADYAASAGTVNPTNIPGYMAYETNVSSAGLQPLVSDGTNIQPASLISANISGNAATATTATNALGLNGMVVYTNPVGSIIISNTVVSSGGTNTVGVQFFDHNANYGLRLQAADFLINVDTEINGHTYVNDLSGIWFGGSGHIDFSSPNYMRIYETDSELIFSNDAAIYIHPSYGEDDFGNPLYGGLIKFDTNAIVHANGFAGNGSGLTFTNGGYAVGQVATLKADGTLGASNAPAGGSVTFPFAATTATNAPGGGNLNSVTNLLGITQSGLIGATAQAAMTIQTPAEDMGYGSYWDFSAGASYAQIQGVMALLKTNGLFDFGYKHIHLDAGWGTNIDLLGHPVVNTNLWPGGMTVCLSNIQSAGFTVGLITDPTGGSGFSTNYQAQTILDELSWGVSELYIQGRTPAGSPDYFELPLIRQNTIKPIWVMVSAPSGATGTWKPQIAFSGNEFQDEMSDNTGFAAAVQNLWLIITNRVMSNIHPGFTSANAGELGYQVGPYVFNGQGSYSARWQVAAGAIIHSPLQVGLSFNVPIYCQYLTNSDVKSIDLDPGMCAPFYVQGSVDPNNILATNWNWLALCSPLGNPNSSRKAVAVLSTDTSPKFYNTDITGAANSAVTWTNYCLNWTNFGYAANQTLLVKQCYYPRYGNRGKGYYADAGGEYMPNWPVPDAYCLSVGTYTNTINSADADLLIVEPASDHPIIYTGTVPLNQITPFNETNNGETSYSTILNRGGGDGVVGVVNVVTNTTISQICGDELTFYTPGIQTLSGLVGLGVASTGGSVTNSFIAIIKTNGVAAWSQLFQSTNASPFTPYATVNLNIAGTTNLSLQCIGTNYWQNSFAIHDDYNYAPWVLSGQFSQNYLVAGGPGSGSGLTNTESLTIQAAASSIY